MENVMKCVQKMIEHLNNEKNRLGNELKLADRRKQDFEWVELLIENEMKKNNKEE